MPKNDDHSTIETIRTYANDIESQESKIKTLKEQLKEIIEKDSNFATVEELVATLAEAREKPKLSLMGNSKYNELAEKLAQEKEGLKESREIMSDYLVEYYATKHEKQVEINPNNGDARDIILNGKLGKEQKKYQTNMFSGAES